MTTTILPMIENSSNGLLVSSEAIAQGTGNQHKSILQMVRMNLADFEQFGRVAFENAPFETAGGNQLRAIAKLNEPQSTLLMTYLRNNEKVKEFKLALVKAFYQMKGLLESPAVQSTLFDLETKGFTFGQPIRELPATSTRHWEDPRTARNDQIAEIARRAKGAWVPFTIDGFSEKQYKEFANAIKYGKRASFPNRGHWEAATRESEIFIRHTPSAIVSIRPLSEVSA